MSSHVIPQRVLDRVWTRIQRGETGECWPTTWSVLHTGYPQIGWSDNGVRGHVLTHRAVWASVNGQIPDGLTIDHLCRNRICGNPGHMRLLTNSANGRLNGQAVATHCSHGHEWDAANTYVRRDTGHRLCRACSTDRTRARGVKPRVRIPGPVLVGRRHGRDGTYAAGCRCDECRDAHAAAARQRRARQM